MTLEEQTDVLENADMLRVLKDRKEIYVGYLALFNPKIGNHKNEVFEKHRNETVKRFRAVPEITHRKWKELNLMQPLQPQETPDFCYKDLQEKLYYTIYL